jgi:hypothetical protein
VCRYHNKFSSSSSTVWNLWPIKVDFNLGNKKKKVCWIQNWRIGRLRMTAILCVDMWAGVMLWCSIQVLFLCPSGLFLCSAFFNIWKVSVKVFANFKIPHVSTYKNHKRHGREVHSTARTQWLIDVAWSGRCEVRFTTTWCHCRKSSVLACWCPI